MFKKIAEKNKKEFMSHIKKEIIERCKQKELISLKEYAAMNMNSYESKYIEPFLLPEAFIWKIENALKNICKESRKYYIPKHYNDYILTDGINELLERYKKLNLK